jgi:hypothetical protein
MGWLRQNHLLQHTFQFKKQSLYYKLETYKKEALI